MENVWRVIFFCGKISLEIVVSFYGENMVNQTTNIVSMGIVWRKCGK